MNFKNKLKPNKDTLQNKIIVSFLLILLFRILSQIPIPWVDTSALTEVADEGILSYANLFSGGALKNYTLMATGISSYISASIVIQILTFSSPKLHDMSKDAAGQKQIKKLTIYLGILSAVLSSFGVTTMLEETYGLLTNQSWYVYVVIAIIHAAGTAIAILIGETITEKGFGNGVSLLIFINIASSIPSQIQNISLQYKMDLATVGTIVIAIVTLIISICFVTFVETSERRLPIQYSQTSMRSGAMGGKDKSYFPIKVNISGVMPVIFASYITQVLSILLRFIETESINNAISQVLTNGTIPNIIFMAICIAVFSYLYNFLAFDVHEISENIQTQGGTIPGIRPGKPTKDYLIQKKNNLTFIGIIYLSIVAIIPMTIAYYTGVTIVASTSLIIIVGVSLETVKSLLVEISLNKKKTFI